MPSVAHRGLNLFGLVHFFLLIDGIDGYKLVSDLPYTTFSQVRIVSFQADGNNTTLVSEMPMTPPRQSAEVKLCFFFCYLKIHRSADSITNGLVLILLKFESNNKE